MGVPKNGWFIVENNPIKMDDLGGDTCTVLVSPASTWSYARNAVSRPTFEYTCGCSSQGDEVYGTKRLWPQGLDVEQADVNP
eukprot:s739_g31.t1